jgi:hypothetical protein
MSTEKTVTSLGSLSEAINSLGFGESVTINLSEMIRNSLKDAESDDSTESKSSDSDE